MTRWKLGWKKQKPDARDYQVAAPTNDVDGFYDLSHWFPPCYDQGDNNSCTGTSVGGAFHYLSKAQGLYDFEPSRMFIYYNAREYEQNIDQDDGAELRSAIKVVNKLGVPDERDWPSTQDHIRAKPPQEIYDKADKTLLMQYAAISDNAAPDDKKRRILSCFTHRIPIIFGFMVFKAFNSARVAKTGIVPDPKGSESAIGGHAVVLVGYNPATRLFKFRNSWGDWGDNGYGYLSEGYILDKNLSSDFWATFLIKKP
jgi:C1A family cysteine protease